MPLRRGETPLGRKHDARRVCVYPEAEETPPLGTQLINGAKAVVIAKESAVDNDVELLACLKMVKLQKRFRPRFCTRVACHKEFSREFRKVSDLCMDAALPSAHAPSVKHRFRPQPRSRGFTRTTLKVFQPA